MGLDADLVLFDPNETWTIQSEGSFSAQEYTPFAGVEVTGQVKRTFLRGQLVFDDDQIVGMPQGIYIGRPSNSD